MNGTEASKPPHHSTTPTDLARQGVRQAETGARAGAKQIEQSETADPAAATAIEQEAADGPEGRGLSR